jgi:hypothetical protein
VGLKRGFVEALSWSNLFEVRFFSCGTMLLFFPSSTWSKMNRLLAQRDLEAMMTSLAPMLPLVSRKSCEAGANVLAGLLGEALEAQEAASKRTDELKQMKPEGLMELFTPEKGNGAAKEKKQEGRNKDKDKPQQQQEEGGGAEAGGAAVSPKKNQAQTPQKKRARKVSEKAAKVGLEDYEDEDDERDEVKKPKKHTNGNTNGEKKKESVKRGQGAWNGEEYPRVTAVLNCDGDGAEGLRVEVHAKKPGRGQWQKVLFSLDSAQLGSIDNLPEKTKHLVKGSFRKALMGRYGQKWPNALRIVLAGTTWARDILPVVAAEVENGMEGDFAGLNPVAYVNFSEVE